MKASHIFFFMVKLRLLYRLLQETIVVEIGKLLHHMDLDATSGVRQQYIRGDMGEMMSYQLKHLFLTYFLLTEFDVSQTK